MIQRFICVEIFTAKQQLLDFCLQLVCLLILLVDIIFPFWKCSVICPHEKELKIEMKVFHYYLLHNLSICFDFTYILGKSSYFLSIHGFN